MAKERLAEQSPPEKYLLTSTFGTMNVDHDPAVADRYVNGIIQRSYGKDAKRWIEASGALKGFAGENLHLSTIWVDQNQERCWILEQRPTEDHPFKISGYLRESHAYLDYSSSNPPDLPEIQIDFWNHDRYYDPNLESGQTIRKNLEFVQWIVTTSRDYSFDPEEGSLQVVWKEEPGRPPDPPLYLMEPPGYQEIGGSIFVELKALTIDENGKAGNFRFISKFFDPNGRMFSRSQDDGIGEGFVAQCRRMEVNYPGEDVRKTLLVEQYQVVPAPPFDEEWIMDFLDGKSMLDRRDPKDSRTGIFHGDLLSSTHSRPGGSR